MLKQFGTCKKYLSILTRKLDLAKYVDETHRFLYCRGVTIVGSFVPPPTNPLSLTQLSSFLSQVNVRMKSIIRTLWLVVTNNSKYQVSILFVDSNYQ